jgi:hypothetical protein
MRKYHFNTGVYALLVSFVLLPPFTQSGWLESEGSEVVSKPHRPGDNRVSCCAGISVDFVTEGAWQPTSKQARNCPPPASISLDMLRFSWGIRDTVGGPPPLLERERRF